MWATAIAAAASAAAETGKAPPAMSGGGAGNNVYIEGMQIPGQKAAGYSQLVWPVVIGVVVLVWLRKK